MGNALQTNRSRNSVRVERRSDLNESDLGEVYCTFIFRSLFIPVSLQTGTRSSILSLAIPIRELVTLQQLPSADFSEPRYLKCSTTSQSPQMCTLTSRFLGSFWPSYNMANCRRSTSGGDEQFDLFWTTLTMQQSGSCRRV